MSRPSFAEQRARWVEQLGADEKLPACAFRVACGLYNHFNSDTGEAWPSVDRLADVLGMHRRLVQKGLARLIKAEHVDQDPGGGRGRTNVYRMRIQKGRPNDRGSDYETTSDQPPFDDEKQRPFVSETVSVRAQKGAHPCTKGRPNDHPNSRGTSEEPVRNLGGRSRASRMHSKAVLNEEWIEEASTLGLSGEAIEREFAQFRDYWLAQPGQKGVKADWLATWRNWCRNALKWQQRGNGRGGGARRMSAAEFIAGREAASQGAGDD